MGICSLYRGERGDEKAVHRKHTDQPTGGEGGGGQMDSARENRSAWVCDQGA
jgi:hypothetical protein